jgi:hypothetical protein
MGVGRVEQRQPLLHPQAAQGRGLPQRLGGQPGQLRVLVAEQGQQFRQGEPGQAVRVVAAEHLDRPLPDRPAPGLFHQVDQGRRRSLPQRLVGRGRRQFRQGVPLGRPPAVRPGRQGRAVVEEGVHQAPLVEQGQSVGDIIVGVLLQGLDNGGQVPVRVRLAEVAEVAPGPAPQVVARVHREQELVVADLGPRDGQPGPGARVPGLPDF